MNEAQNIPDIVISLCSEVLQQYISHIRGNQLFILLLALAGILRGMRTEDKSVVENIARSARGISKNLRIKQLSGNTFRNFHNTNIRVYRYGRF
jgi:hypothetical protein